MEFQGLSLSSRVSLVFRVMLERLAISLDQTRDC